MRQSTGHGSPLAAHGPWRPRDARAAAKNWAASAASCTTCSAPPSRAAPTSCRPSPAPGSRAPRSRDHRRGHPFTRSFEDLSIGETITTDPAHGHAGRYRAFRPLHRRHVLRPHGRGSGAQANPFFPGRVAHGYLLLSFAAGMFVSPPPARAGQYRAGRAAFMKPVSPGDAISVELTVKRKTRRTDSTAKSAGMSRC
jgi:hypothetical protein